ncbi:hypothetical protein [Massilia sp. CF038]|uniref:hypothetical protein n=1 Tax=Massilia sp. CF038 TaxID=1881045 RepID=UPI00091AC8D3|nr:hypothetical protein [Massilia sp. CF038]SHH69945.1 hypothetical protein SAMN05428948_4998 [Massilia sp. CF038]
MTATGRQAAFVLILAFHILAIWLLPQRTRLDDVRTAATPLQITFVRPVAPAPAPVVSLPSPVRNSKSVPRQPKPVRAVPESPPAMVLIPAPPVDQAPAAPSAHDILQRARADLGRIDRAIRIQSPDPGARSIRAQTPRLEAAMASAFRERGPARIEELVLADGTRVSKVGNMCAFKESNSLTGGRDVFKDGIKTRWQTCPK